ncbi:hypothetical protein WA026_021461 [Henosepilachna vigintioctopunctata]|uniref:Palmitoyltransferase n=1 Tax=Henosepilachna vigintioctopunctata TaxID=420089 RepID=A0AAW1UIT2_9CUCU
MSNDTSDEDISFFRQFIDYLKWIPVLMATGILIWATVIYMISISQRTEGIIKIIFVTIFVTIFFMIYWSYLRVICARSTEIPEEFKLSPPIHKELAEAKNMKQCHEILKEFSKNLPIKCMNLNGSVRYCEKCKQVKPDRCHHCSSCKTCILKMDHHCPWINNCVSFANYKFFFLFLTYLVIGCIYVICTTFSEGYTLWKTGELHGTSFQIVSLFFMAVLLGFSTITLLVYHCYLLVKNETTIESMRKPVFRSDFNIKSYDIGFKQNFCEVFGNNPWLWCLPIFTTRGEGIDFPVEYFKSEEIPLV